MWKSFANGGGGFYNFAENVSKNSQIYIINIMKLKNFFLAALAAAFAFASCELIDPDTTPETPDQEQTPGDTEKPGDTEVPGVTYTSIADFNAAEVSEEVFYTVKGTIVNIEEISASFKNATLTIADESGAQLNIYRMKPAGEDKIEELGLTLGDVLVVKGNRGEYNGNIQMVNPVYVSHEDKEAPAVVVTEIGLAAFNALEDSNADLYRISGTIKEISAINTQYQNVNVTIVDEAGDEVYIFRLKVADESDKTLEQLALKVGDVLTVVGNKSSYNGDPQMVNGKYESHVVGESPEIPEEPKEPETPEVPGAAKYVKVTADQTDWTGKYLIVFGSKAHAEHTSAKDLNATVDVAPVDGVIEASDELKDAVLTVTKSGEAYNMTFADGKYFGMQHNGCLFSDTAFNLGFKYTDAGVEISGYVSAKNATYYLYNNSGSYFRCYVHKNGQSGYTFPDLYKYTE